MPKNDGSVALIHLYQLDFGHDMGFKGYNGALMQDI